MIKNLLFASDFKHFLSKFSNPDEALVSRIYVPISSIVETFQ